MPAGVCAHTDWPVDELSGLENWRDRRASKTECMSAGVFLWTHELLQTHVVEVAGSPPPPSFPINFSGGNFNIIST